MTNMTTTSATLTASTTTTPASAITVPTDSATLTASDTLTASGAPHVPVLCRCRPPWPHRRPPPVAPAHQPGGHRHRCAVAHADGQRDRRTVTDSPSAAVSVTPHACQAGGCCDRLAHCGTVCGTAQPTPVAAVTASPNVAASVTATPPAAAPVRQTRLLLRRH